MNQQTEQAHKDLRNILLKGRILLNGMPLTGTEMGIVIQGEQMLFEKASRLDVAQELDTQKKEVSKNPKKKTNIIPIRQPALKEKE